MNPPELTSSLVPLIALLFGALAGCAGVIFARRGIELALVTMLAIVVCIGHAAAGELTIARAREAVLANHALTPAEQANESEWLDAQAGGRLIVDGGCTVALVVIAAGALARGLARRRDAAAGR